MADTAMSRQFFWTVGEKNLPTVGAAPLRDFLWLGIVYHKRFLNRNLHTESAAFAFFAANVDTAAMCFGYGFYDG